MQVDRLDGLNGGVAVKAPVVAVATSPITLYGEQTIGSVACVENDRVLVTAQADATTNGIYFVKQSTWVRTPDFDGNRDVVTGTIVYVDNANIGYRLTSPNPVRIGTDALTFALFTNNFSYVPTVLEFGAVGDGVADDTVALQAALDSGIGLVYLPPGTYKVSSPLTIHSNTRVLGAGAECTTIRVDPLLWPMVGGVYQIIRNENYTASSLTDHDISLEHIKLDYTDSLPSPSGGGAHAFTCRYATNVRALFCNFYGGESGTAFLACKDTWVEGCKAEEFNTSAFDHWDGAGVAKVIGCVARARVSGGSTQGIQFTGTGSLGEVRDSYDVTIMGNTVFGVNEPSASAIIVNMANTGSTVRNAKIIGNHVEESTYAFVLDGAINTAIISGNTCRNCSGNNLFLQPHGAEMPAAVVISGNVFHNPSISPGDIGVLNVGGLNVTITGNQIYGGTYPAATYITATNVIMKGNYFPVGTSTGHVLSGAVNVVSDEPGFYNKGTGTINSGSTSATVTHGLYRTPALGEISIIGGEDPTNSVGTVWISNIGATTFQVNCENNPGASNWDFGWRVSPP